MAGSPVPRRALAAAVILVCAVAAPGAAWAQIVNVQSILATEAREGLSGSLTGSADWRTGNVDFLFLGASPVARFRAGDHLLIGIVRAEYRTSKGTTLVSRSFEHLRYRYRFVDRVLGEVFAQHEFDAIRRLELRTLVGAGPKVDLIEGEGYGLGVGVAYMIEYERIRNDDEVDAGQTDLQHRISSYLIGHYAIDERLQLVNTSYAQPRLTDLGDFRVLNQTQLVIAVTTRLAATTAFNLSYDSAPPATVKKLDTALISSFTYEF